MAVTGAARHGAAMEPARPAAALPADVFVVDAVIHALNLSRGNIASRYGQQLYDMSYGLHAMLTPPDRRAPADVYMSDMDPAALVATMFTETQTSLAVTHSLTLDSWFHDGFAAEWKTVAMARAHPDRVLAYVGVDPSGERDAVLDDLDRQMEDLPTAVGLKLYPHQMDPYRHWLTDSDTVLRLIERAAAHGLRSVGDPQGAAQRRRCRSRPTASAAISRRRPTPFRA